MWTTTYSLLERLQRPDEAGIAWQRFAAIYSPLLLCWARRLGLSPTDANDLIQEVFLVLLQKLPTFRRTPHRRFRGWLWTITRNKAHELRRRVPLLLNQDALADEPQAEDEQAEREMAEELALLSQRALALLERDFPPNTWKAFWETAVAGRPGKEVAAELGLTVGAVYAAHFRVLKRLREELEGFLD